MEEIWRDIQGYEGLYKVSNMGNVKSLNYRRTGLEKNLKFDKDNHGYLYVILCKNNERKTFRVHRLVAQAFIDNPNNYPQVNHKDENKLNNTVKNLEYCSSSYNNNYGTRNERVGNVLSKSLYCFETTKYYKSITEVSKDLNLYKSNIVSVLKGRQKRTGGYTFRYAKDVIYHS